MPDRSTARLVCECGKVKVGGRCPVCHPLRRPFARVRRAEHGDTTESQRRPSRVGQRVTKR